MNIYFFQTVYLTLFVVISLRKSDCQILNSDDTKINSGIYQTIHKELIEDRSLPNTLDIIPVVYSQNGENLKGAGLLQNRKRRKRASGLDLYKHIAVISGGSIHQANKSTIHGAVGVLSEATLTNPVLIQKWESINKADNREFDVDQTLDTILVEIYSITSVHCTIINPHGLVVVANGKNITLPVNSTSIKFTRIKNPITGKWKIRCSDQNYNITVRGSSLVDFDSKFVDGFGMEVSGRPLSGSNMTMALEVMGMEYLFNLSQVVLTSLSGDVISKYSVGDPIGRHRNLYRCHVTIPRQDFMVSILGYDKGGTSVERMSQVPVIPEGVTLILKELSPDFPSTGGEYEIQYEIFNDGAGDGVYSIDVTVDVKLFPFTISPKTVHLNNGEHARGNITFTANAKVGESSLAVVSVTGPSGASQYSSIQLVVEDYITRTVSTEKIVSSTILVRSTRLSQSRTTAITVAKASHVHVASTRRIPARTNPKITGNTVLTESSVTNAAITPRKKSDLKPPAFTKVDYIDNCRSDKACNKYQWIVLFEVQDDESGIHMVDVDDRTLSSISIESFSDGLSKTPIHGNVSINCCKKQVTIIVEDKEGNRGRFPVHYQKKSGHNQHNSDESARRHAERLSSLQIAAIVVGSFAGCLVAVIVCTVIIQFKSYRNRINQKLSKKGTAKVV